VEERRENTEKFVTVMLNNYKQEATAEREMSAKNKMDLEVLKVEKENALEALAAAEERIEELESKLEQQALENAPM